MDRSAFLYMEPAADNYGDRKKFAQCETCRMWTGPEGNTCIILGPKVEVTGDMTCGLYVNGAPKPDHIGEEEARVTPEVAGLEKREVRCENCGYFGKGHCGLFSMLHMPSKVSDNGCCNANTKDDIMKIKVGGETPSSKFFKKV